MCGPDADSREGEHQPPKQGRATHPCVTAHVLQHHSPFENKKKLKKQGCN